MKQWRRTHRITALAACLALLLNILVVFGAVPLGIAEDAPLGLLPNGGFESGTWTGLYDANPVEGATLETRADYVHSGANSLKLDAASFAGRQTNCGVDEGVFRSMDFVNKHYAFVLWIKTENFKGNLFMTTKLFKEGYASNEAEWHLYDLRILPGVGGIQVIGKNVRPTDYYVDDLDYGTKDWTKVIIPVGTSEPAANFSMHVRLGMSGSSTGTVWVDDVDMIEYDPTAIASTVVDNGNMENGAWMNGDVISTETNLTYVHSGYKSMKITPVAGTDYWPNRTGATAAFANLDFANKAYAFRAWIKADSFDGTVWLSTLIRGGERGETCLYDPRLNNPGLGGIYIVGADVRVTEPYVSNQVLTNADWYQVIVPIQSNDPTATEMDVRLFASGTGTVWVDDIDLIEIAKPEVNSGLINNADMEKGTWGDLGTNPVAGVTSETDPSNVHSGEKSLKITAPVVTAAVNATNETLFRGLDLTNKNYAFTAWVKTENFSGKFFAETNLFSEGYAQNGNFYAVGAEASNRQIAFIDDEAYGTKDWTKIVIPVKASNLAAITMHVYLGATGTGTVWVDDIDLVEYTGSPDDPGDDPGDNPDDDPDDTPDDESQYKPVLVGNGAVNNGDIEAGSWADNAFVTTETRPDYVNSGKKSMKITPTGAGWWDNVISANEAVFQAMDFANKTYAFTMWVKTENFKGTLYVTTVLYDVEDDVYTENSHLYDPRIGSGISGIQMIGGNIRPTAPYVDDVNYGTKDWTKIVVPVATNNPDADAMHIRIGATGTGTVWVDDVDMEEYDASAAPDTVIVQNGNMENGAWTNSTFVATESNPDYVHTGDKSMKLTPNPNSSSPATDFWPNRTVGKAAFADLDFENKTYAFRVWIKADNFNGTAWVSTLISGGDRGETWLYDPRLNNPGLGGIYFVGKNIRNVDPYVDAEQLTNTDWTEVIVPILTNDPTATSMDIRIFATGSGTLWVDDVDLIEFTPGGSGGEGGDGGDTPDPNDKNLTLNGDFELGGAEHYIVGEYGSAAVIDGDVKHGGKQALRLDGAEAGNIFAGTTLKPGEFDPANRYRLSLWVKTEDVEEDGFYLKMLQGRTDTGTAVAWVVRYGRENHFTTSGTTDWTLYEMDLFGFHKDADKLDIYVYLYGTGKVWVDDIRFEKIEFDPSAPAGTVSADTPAGVVEPMTQVNLFTGTANGDIYYTVDGSDPRTSADKMLYDSAYPIVITEDMTLKAYTVSEGTDDGEVFTWEYTVSRGLVDNGGFEEGMWKDTSIYYSFEPDTTVKKEGKQSLRVDPGVATQWMKTDWISMEPMYDYELTFWLKTQDLAEDTISVTLKLQTARGETYFMEKPDFMVMGGTQDWTQYTIKLDRLDGSTISAIQLQFNILPDSGLAWFDDVYLRAFQKTSHAISVVPDVKQFGNLFYESIYDPYFTPDIGVTLKNSAKNEQRLTVEYTITDDATGRVYPGATIETEVPPQGDNRIDSLDLSMATAYGTYTVNFRVTDQYGATYDVEGLQVSRMLAEQEPGENDDRIGVCGDMLTGEYANWKERLEQMASAGITWVRADLRWENIERVAGQYVWPKDIDEKLAYAKELGINALLIIGTWNNSNYDNGEFPTSEEGLAGFERYCTAIATHFKGVVDHYEIGNEFNLTHPNEPVSTYTNAVKRAYKAIKAVDSNIQVASGVTSNCDIMFIRKMMEEGIYDYTDIITIHPYCVANATPENFKLVEQIKELDEMIASYGNGVGKPIWATEIGFTTPYQNYYSITYEQQAALTIRALLLTLEKGSPLDKIIFYMDRDAGSSAYYWEYTLGLTQKLEAAVPAQPKPALLAMGAFSTLCFGGESLGKQELDGGVNMFGYKTKNDTRLMALYARDDRLKQFRMTLSGEDVMLYDMYGNPVLPDFEEENVLSLKLNGSIVYVELSEGVDILDTETEDLGPDPDAPGGSGGNGGDAPSVNTGESPVAVTLCVALLTGSALCLAGMVWSRKRKNKGAAR